MYRPFTMPAGRSAEFEEEFSFVGFPKPAMDALQARNESLAIQRAASAGFRDENTLTDLVFFARHPERNGAPLRSGEAGLAALGAEWVAIRDRLVRATPRPSAPAAPAPPQPGAPDIVEVRGIRVARQIAAQVDALLAAAQADGVPLAGSGYRSPAEQIAVRRKNCGPSAYDIYDKSPSQCTPPTARPGSSMHERGLAIDFKYGTQMAGQFKDTPGFGWLQRNAARFGLKNYAKEPWHWSTTGT
ncbi:M15 family metallopeptidase [Variovorax saccharolyticus]|uniref:M15 family metallopeptidase n=1 Tax=Variovorax saccharolyticus TaxID=3053516 RepID=UPI002575A842|nr:M15 family metallopeptidase [Variovorax sp. J22R187]MDM0018915.1 M15 family metallopeptidase [Variovorax sp. J22R187]